MDCRCRLGSSGNSSTASGSSDPGGTYFFLCPHYFFPCSLFPACLFICFCYLILAVPMRKISGEHSWMSSFLIAILNASQWELFLSRGEMVIVLIETSPIKNETIIMLIIISESRLLKNNIFPKWYNEWRVGSVQTVHSLIHWDPKKSDQCCICFGFGMYCNNKAYLDIMVLYNKNKWTEALGPGGGWMICHFSNI